jgi:hypothetical protein
LFLPISLTMIVSHTPLFGSPPASCSNTKAIDRCWNAGLPKVIGVASFAVGPAELASGVKSKSDVLRVGEPGDREHTGDHDSCGQRGQTSRLTSEHS